MSWCICNQANRHPTLHDPSPYRIQDRPRRCSGHRKDTVDDEDGGGLSLPLYVDISQTLSV